MGGAMQQYVCNLQFANRKDELLRIRDRRLVFGAVDGGGAVVWYKADNIF
jgi:hypothetical protein